MKLTGKKLFLIGFIVVLLIGIPTTIYIIQQQTQTASKAQKSTDLTFEPVSSETAPLQKNVGDNIPLDIMVDPGTNLVSFVKLSIQYDSDKLATASANAFQPNTLVFPTVLEGPIYSPGKIEVTLSVGPDPTKSIQILSKAGTVTFKAIANTPDGQPTLVTYGVTSQVLSIGSSDQASENVLSSTTPATIAIGGAAASPSPSEGIPTGTLTPTVPLTETPVPTETPEPTVGAGTPTPTFSPTPTGTGSAGATNVVPVCTSLDVDRATTGSAPFAITFTATGNDSDGTVSIVNFNFGDGAVSGDITTSGGLGTNSVNVAVSHEYQNPGTYTASAVLTDSNGGTSDATSCQQTIIAQESTGGTGGGSSDTATSTPTPTMAATGPAEVMLSIGAIAMFLIIGGGLLFFVL